MENSVAHIALVDDDKLIHSTVEAIIAPMNVSMDSFYSPQEFLKTQNFEKYDCLVTDVRMMGINGVKLIENLRDKGCNLPFMVITSYCVPRIVVSAMKLGAENVLEKPFDDQIFWDSISNMIQANKVRKEKDLMLKKILSNFESLQQTDLDVLKPVCLGETNKAIAHELDLSTRSIDMKKNAIMQKMEVDSIAELMYKLSQIGYLDEVYQGL